MGYGLPAAIGAYYATGKPTACICGDGALQMNIQELEWVKRENLPVKIMVMNNEALGMIRHLQRDYFDCLFAGLRHSRTENALRCSQRRSTGISGRGRPETSGSYAGAWNFCISQDLSG